ncbi:protein tramtrack, beta isoform isoform X12 [Hyalella azteca]|uniref:Protein tramtrack, beta isoform isoform X12 n=1 Tax=Hyalella azteca TaxID=294128 RepID=A0A979FXA1_HYAAZ|nr:protein tramtrack, beta isoform isoform X12 [Hyalella azteca]
MEELLSLKWNNHRSTFLHILAVLRDKQLYTDATLACDGKLYSVHKLVLSTCSDYFSSMLDRTSCKSPVIVLKDIKSDDLEALLDYMYLGEVNVRQSDLSTLIKAAECLRVKGLAVADDEPPPPRKSSKSDYSSRRSESTSSPPAKRKRRGDAIEDGRDDVRPTRTDNRRVSPSTSRPKSPPSTTFTSPTNPLKANSSSANARNSVDDPSVAKSSNSNDDYVDLAPCIKVEMTEDSDRPPDDDSNMDGNTGDMGEGLPDSYGVDSENFKEEDDPDDGDLNSDLPEFLQQATAGYQHSSFGGPSFPSDLSWQGNEDNGGSGSGYGAAASSAQYPAHDAAQSSAGGVRGLRPGSSSDLQSAGRSGTDAALPVTLQRSANFVNFQSKIPKLFVKIPFTETKSSLCLTSWTKLKACTARTKTHLAAHTTARPNLRLRYTIPMKRIICVLFAAVALVELTGSIT